MARINQGWLSSAKPKYSDDEILKLGEDEIDTDISNMDAENISFLIMDEFDFMEQWSVFYAGKGQWRVSVKPEIKEVPKRIYDFISKIPQRKFKISEVNKSEFEQNFSIYVLK